MILLCVVYTVPVRGDSRKSRARVAQESRKSRASDECITTNSCIRVAVAFGASELRSPIGIEDRAILTFACRNTYHRAPIIPTDHTPTALQTRMDSWRTTFM